MVVPDEHTRKAIAEMQRLDWKEKINFKFRRCYLSGQPIRPLTKAMVGCRSIHGPGGESHVVIEKWALSTMLTMARLKHEHY